MGCLVLDRSGQHNGRSEPTQLAVARQWLSSQPCWEPLDSHLAQKGPNEMLEWIPIGHWISPCDPKSSTYAISDFQLPAEEDHDILSPSQSYPLFQPQPPAT